MKEPSGRSKGTILIVDDEPNVTWFISKVCQPAGYETLTAGSGLEALKFIQECGDRIDVVLLDLRMPGMGGLEVLKSIRKHQPDLPVIILTAIHDKRTECEKLGIEAFIKKPYSLEELYSRIEAVIERQQSDKKDLEMDPSVKPRAKILIVDDDRDVCEILSSALREDVPDADFEVRWVNSGDEALRVSSQFEPDIAIIDIKMPHMWGDELIRRFKSGEGHAPQDYVIYSSVSDPEEVSRAKKLGHKMLTKPTDIETLFEVLKKICVRHRLLADKPPS